MTQTVTVNTVTAGLSSILNGAQILTHPNHRTKAPKLDINGIHNYSKAVRYRQRSGKQKTGTSISSVGSTPAPISINVKTLTGKQIQITFPHASFKQTAVSTLKQKIQTQEGIELEQQKLMFDGVELQDSKTFGDYAKIGTGSTILMSQEGSQFTYLFDSSILDPKYDYDYEYPAQTASQKSYQRGDQDFERPYGWYKKALKVIGKYADDEWLGVTGRTAATNTVVNEWPVSYHGTKKEFAENIALKGYDISCGKRFAHGKGIYSTPSPKLAEPYAQVFQHGGDSYKMMLMNRVNTASSSTKVVIVGAGKYFVTSDDKDVRPYAFLFKKT